MDAGLYPELGPKRGEAMKWIVWSNVSLAEAASRLMYASDPSKSGAHTSCAYRRPSPRQQTCDGPRISTCGVQVTVAGCCVLASS